MPLKMQKSLPFCQKMKKKENQKKKGMNKYIRIDKGNKSFPY